MGQSETSETEGGNDSVENCAGKEPPRRNDTEEISEDSESHSS